MGSRHVRIDDSVYSRIEAHKKENETFSETIDRLTSDYTLVDFAQGTEPIGVTNDDLEAATAAMSPTVDEDEQ
jgi:predicted CopG family antitoxin